MFWREQELLDPTVQLQWAVVLPNQKSWASHVLLKFTVRELEEILAYHALGINDFSGREDAGMYVGKLDEAQAQKPRAWRVSEKCSSHQTP